MIIIIDKRLHVIICALHVMPGILIHVKRLHVIVFALHVTAGITIICRGAGRSSSGGQEAAQGNSSQGSGSLEVACEELHA